MFYNTSMVAMLQENGRMRRIMSERKRSEERVVLVRKSHRRKKEKRGKFMDAEKIKTMTEKNKNYMPNRNRYASMRYRRAGTSGLKIPEVSLGLWHNFGSVDCFENMRDMIFTAFDAGVTLFDIANNYGPVPWSAEKNFGRILKNDLAAYRDEMVITTKAGYYGWDGPYGDDGSRKYLIASLDRSLKNIGVDYVDVFYHHRPASETPLEETCMALKRIIDSGKALYIGISNYFSEDMEAAVKILSEYRIPIILDQVRYSMFDRRVEKDGLLAAAKQEGIGLTIFSPLEQGILTDRYLNGIPEDSRAGKGGGGEKMFQSPCQNADHGSCVIRQHLPRQEGRCDFPCFFRTVRQHREKCLNSPICEPWRKKNPDGMKEHSEQRCPDQQAPACFTPFSAEGIRRAAENQKKGEIAEQCQHGPDCAAPAEEEKRFPEGGRQRLQRVLIVTIRHETTPFSAAAIPLKAEAWRKVRRRGGIRPAVPDVFFCGGLRPVLPAGRVRR